MVVDDELLMLELELVLEAVVFWLLLSPVGTAAAVSAVIAPGVSFLFVVEAAVLFWSAEVAAGAAAADDSVLDVEVEAEEVWQDSEII